MSGEVKSEDSNDSVDLDEEEKDKYLQDNKMLQVEVRKARRSLGNPSGMQINTL